MASSASSSSTNPYKRKCPGPGCAVEATKIDMTVHLQQSVECCRVAVHQVRRVHPWNCVWCGATETPQTRDGRMHVCAGLKAAENWHKRVTAKPPPPKSNIANIPFPPPPSSFVWPDRRAQTPAPTGGSSSSSQHRLPPRAETPMPPPSAPMGMGRYPPVPPQAYGRNVGSSTPYPSAASQYSQPPQGRHAQPPPAPSAFPQQLPQYSPYNAPQGTGPGYPVQYQNTNNPFRSGYTQPPTLGPARGAPSTPNLTPAAQARNEQFRDYLQGRSARADERLAARDQDAAEKFRPYYPGGQGGGSSGAGPN